MDFFTWLVYSVIVGLLIIDGLLIIIGLVKIVRLVITAGLVIIEGLVIIVGFPFGKAIMNSQNKFWGEFSEYFTRTY